MTTRHSWVLCGLLVLACRGSDGDQVNRIESPSPTFAAAALKIQCQPASRKAFEDGLFLLHNMMYVQARVKFEAAAQTDTSCSMLHWGVAMTHFHPLWPGAPSPEALDAGAAATKRALESSADSSRARDYAQAVAAYYQDSASGDRKVRKLSWEQGQKKLAEQHPLDVDAQALYLLSRLATASKKDRTYAVNRDSGKRLEALLKEHASHPGLIHYLLHAYDNPVLAKRAVPAAQSYEAAAPDAPHALHMPSHIYVRLGNWQQTIRWNLRSAAAAEKQPLADGSVSRHFLHALDYVVYAYLQVADDDKAMEWQARVDPKVRFERKSGPGAYAMAASKARVALERRAWREAASLTPRYTDYEWDDFPFADSMLHVARGIGAARTGKRALAQRSLKALAALAEKEKNEYWKARIGIQMQVLSAWIAHSRDDDANAVALMTRAATTELAGQKHPVEPGHVVSAAGHLGYLYLELGRHNDALETFEAALQRAPHRFNLVFGAGRAAELGKRADKAKAYYAALIERSNSKSSRPQLKHATEYLAEAR